MEPEGLDFLSVGEGPWEKQGLDRRAAILLFDVRSLWRPTFLATGDLRVTRLHPDTRPLVSVQT